ncbi:protein of unknown function (DUF4496), putative [Trypanosoma equiperdum]|uniref:CCDC81 HU domain-containing protein n=2 Tax=Trypanozoon TaxID=39700 RepID=Q38AJ1_TRYB2|nr:hypothetical protein, conserved [Trypanosoma brucei brucei TREU927]EAN78179.1 hypothetical protein, conserved [Trypanosoma brucei brucei TREU927]SCU65507.1 Domain of unknown function (DUF4496), putative [Trypanosoma equiperdum]
MLSVQGAISNSSIMMECTASQDSYKREVFLLSELERVWDAVSTCIRHYVTEGRNVRVCNFGSFWFETRPVASDGRERYHARRIRFGIDGKFALRYNIDSIRVPQEPSKLEYVKVNMADVVAIARVPAQTAAMALREFFSYVGEGIFKKQVFKINFPGVATLVIKREKAVLIVEEGLRRDIFAVDSRKWPVAVREAAAGVVLDEQRRPVTRSSISRPSTGCSISSRMSNAPKPIEPRPAFMPAAPRNRLFAEIEKDPPRRLPLQHALQNKGDENCSPSPLYNENVGYVKESIFDALDPWEMETPSMEPEIELVEEVPEQLPSLRAYEEEAPHPVVCGRHSYHDHSSVRDLLYGSVTPRTDPMLCGRRRYINRDADQVATLLKDL